jgi:HSP20 family protein
MYLRRFNRPVPANPLTTVLDEFFTKGLNELAGQNFSFNRPSVNIIENDDTFEVKLAAPGLKKEDFEIKIDKDQLLVKVSQVEESEDKNEEGNTKYRRREFNYGSFSRSFHLPETIDTEGIKAAYTDGVLTITLDKKEEAKPKEPQLIAIS